MSQRSTAVEKTRAISGCWISAIYSRLFHWPRRAPPLGKHSVYKKAETYNIPTLWQDND
jgi:hypothetical protein